MSCRMIVFDSKAATDAYLAALPAAAHLKAIHYTQGGHWLLLWGWLVSVLAAVAIARMRLLPTARRWVEGRRRRPWLTALAAAVVFSLADALLELPWNAYSDWWRNTLYGLTSQPFVGWLTEGLLSAAIGAVFFGLFFMLLYALIRRTPRWWWAWGAGLASAFFVVMLVLEPVLIEPLFNHYTPAPPGPTRTAVALLAEGAGVPSDKIYIYNGSKQSNRYTANVSGLFGTARVAMSDTMFTRGADIGEVRAVVGHEMGHYKRGHLIFEALFLSILALIGLGLTQVLFWTRGCLGGDRGDGPLADPIGLADADGHHRHADAAGDAPGQHRDPADRERRRRLRAAGRARGRTAWPAPWSRPSNTAPTPRLHPRGGPVLRPPQRPPPRAARDELESRPPGRGGRPGGPGRRCVEVAFLASWSGMRTSAYGRPALADDVLACHSCIMRRRIPLGRHVTGKLTFRPEAKSGEGRIAMRI